MTKSGTTSGNLIPAATLASLDVSIQVTSGDLTAPDGRVKPPEESKTLPCLVVRFQMIRSAVRSPFFSELSYPAGDIVTNSPSAVSSNRMSGLSWHSSSNSWCVIRRRVIRLVSTNKDLVSNDCIILLVLSRFPICYSASI